MLGEWIAFGFTGAIGAAAYVAPVALTAIGALMVAGSALIDVRPFRTGLAVTSFGLLAALGAGHGGAIGSGLQDLFGLLVGGTGTTIIGVLALLVGTLLLSGASAGALVRRSGHAVRRAHTKARRARPIVQAEPAPVIPLRAPEPPVDAVHDFPDVVGDGIAATRQDVMYFGTPAGDCRFDASAFPGWINFGAGRWYGMASHEPRGVKIADDVAGPPIDPTSLDRVISADAVRSARAFLRRRFPALAVQPVVESRVCQYEYAPDADFLLDRHPAADNVWLAGGGSGHGFKMGPAVGEYVARLVLDHAVPDGPFTYAHFADGRRRVDRADGRKIHW